MYGGGGANSSAGSEEARVMSEKVQMLASGNGIIQTYIETTGGI